LKKGKIANPYYEKIMDNKENRITDLNPDFAVGIVARRRKL